jgi:hypothetical protein
LRAGSPAPHGVQDEGRGNLVFAWDYFIIPRFASRLRGIAMTRYLCRLYQQVAEKVFFSVRSSFLGKQESSLFKDFWTPAFAGVTDYWSFFASC